MLLKLGSRVIQVYTFVVFFVIRYPVFDSRVNILIITTYVITILIHVKIGFCFVYMWIFLTCQFHFHITSTDRIIVASRIILDIYVMEINFAFFLKNVHSRRL